VCLDAELDDHGEDVEHGRPAPPDSCSMRISLSGPGGSPTSGSLTRTATPCASRRDA